MSTHANTYYLSNKDAKQIIDLKEKLRVIMPVMREVADELVFNTVIGRFKNSNFIIHEASLILGLACDHIENLNYRITLLDKISKEVEGVTKFWIGVTACRHWWLIQIGQ